MTRPKFLGEIYARAFLSPRVAQAYQHRPPYAAEVFNFLGRLLTTPPNRVLDLGCGTGFVARYLVPHVAQVDAVDVSEAMIARGVRLPNGDHPRLRWMVGSAETVRLHPPYNLVTAGDSLHWMDWEVVLPRLKGVLDKNAYLAILSAGTAPTPWDDALAELVKRYSTNQDYELFDLVGTLTARGLFKPCGEHQTTPLPFEQPLEAYAASFHGRSSLSKDAMGPRAEAFGAALRALLRAFQGDSEDETVRLELVSTITWGKPLAPAAGLC